MEVDASPIYALSMFFYRDAGPKAANIPKPLVPNPHSTTFTHGATYC